MVSFNISLPLFQSADFLFFLFFLAIFFRRVNFRITVSTLFDATYTEGFNRLLQTEQRIELLSRYQDLFDFQETESAGEDEDEEDEDLDEEEDEENVSEDEAGDKLNDSMEVDKAPTSAPATGGEGSLPPQGGAMEVDVSASTSTAAEQKSTEGAGGEAEEQPGAPGEGNDESGEPKKRGRPRKASSLKPQTRMSTRGRKTRRGRKSGGGGGGGKFQLKRVYLTSAVNPGFQHDIPAGKEIPAFSIMVDEATSEVTMTPVISATGSKAKRITMTISVLMVNRFFFSFHFFILPVVSFQLLSSPEAAFQRKPL